MSVVYADIKEIEKNNHDQQKIIISVDGVGHHQSTLKLLESQLVNKYQLWADYKNIARSGSQGFSKHFFHIANLSDENISLYEIEIYDRGSRLAMKGYARQAAYIPNYINKLKKQTAFQQVAFGNLSIEKLKGHDVMRFSLDKEKSDPEAALELKSQEKIDVSKLMNMTLSDGTYQFSESIDKYAAVKE